jgi:hypothetical protein
MPMMNHFIDQKESAGGDGASEPTQVDADGTPAEIDRIEAWSLERHEGIESRLLRERVHRPLSQILHGGELGPKDRARVRLLIAAIRATEHGRRDRGI